MVKSEIANHVTKKIGNLAILYACFTQHLFGRWSPLHLIGKYGHSTPHGVSIFKIGSTRVSFDSLIMTWMRSRERVVKG